MDKIKVGFGLLAVLLLAGCYAPSPEMERAIKAGTAPVTSNIEEAITSNDWLTVRVRPIKPGSRGYRYFTIYVRNRTDKDIEIDWNKTLFIDNGQTSGGFMFEGIQYSQANAPKAPDIVLPKQTFTKDIYPIKRLTSSGQFWSFDDILNFETDSGDFGVSFCFKVDGKEIRETLTVKLTRNIQ